ncbi:MAG: rhomboid family intramembrane serine protease [Phycisphaerae bacterium]|jgi:membrane associated rhomboid family serine protease|nr:rhomboid family intramembrane serine protease [Phycisphaerae bacterium]MDP7289200.1 rhomboid family intramembrane serine protease [Phycisphaerae bacterium]
MFFLLPYRAHVPTDCKPWANYAIMALTIAISIAAFNDAELLMQMAGLNVVGIDLFEVEVNFTSDAARYPLLSLTSSLVHGGYVHLAANMLFLWVFGNAVNYKFGHWRYLVFYALCALVSGMAHYTFRGGPVIGASGAIFGVMGAFLIYFPRNDLEVLSVFFLRMGTQIISSGWMILFWIAWNLLMLKLDWGGQTALWSHIGGFAAGFAMAVICLKTKWIVPDQDEESLFDVFARK